MRRAFLILLAAGISAACGGGSDLALGPGDGGIGSGGTGAVAVVASGPVQGFGSIIVNGTRYETDNARFELRDTQVLKLGMTVQVTGTVSPDLSVGTATLVISAAQLRGAVSAVDPAARAFRVLGVPVMVDDSTIFATAEGLQALSEGSQVQVWGQPREGALLATRVEQLATTATPVVTETVRDLNPSSGSFRLGTLEVDYQPAALEGGWAGGGIATGQPARVSGSIDASGRLEATRVEPAQPQPQTASTVLSLSGSVAQLDGSRFRLDGYTVDSASAQVTGGTLGEGVRVEVLGPVRDRILTATRIRVRQGNSGNSGSSGSGSTGGTAAVTYSAAGPIGALRSDARFSVRGQDVDARSGQVQFVNGSATDLRPGRKVLVTGSRVQGDVLIAERVEFTD